MMHNRYLGLKGIFLITFVAVAIAAVVAQVGCSKPDAVAGADPHKQLWHCGMHPQVIQDHPGDCPICHMALTRLKVDSSSANGGEKKILYWWDPMLGRSSISDHPGKSAMNRDLVPVYATQGGPEVQIDPALVQNMGVRTATVTRGPLMKTVRTVGMLKLPERGMHDVSLKIGGWIDTLYANEEGMHVEKGQPLFELYSQELQVAEQELISSVKSEKLLGASASPALRQEAHDLVESVKRKLRLWDIAERDIEAIANSDQAPRVVPYRSPATGHIEDKMIVQGSAVQAGMKLLRIADHTEMWLDAQVYQEQLSVVRPGHEKSVPEIVVHFLGFDISLTGKPHHEMSGPEVVATIEGIPGNPFKGAIDFAYPHMDPATRTLTVRITLKNPGLELRPGMYATVEIITQPEADAIQVPREAVIDTGTRQIVFVAESEGHFSPRIVQMGIMGDNDMVQIIDGLAPGETVVTSGQFLMDVESRTIEATQKLSAGASMPPAETPSAPATPSPGEAVSTGPVPSAPAMPPAEAPKSLAQVYCSMADGNWLQIGDQVSNPYKGQQMSTCGEIRKKLPAPPAGSELSAFVTAYLDVQKGMNADKLDGRAIVALKTSAETLPVDKDGALRDATAKLADAKDLNAARMAFKAVSDQLIAVLQRPVK